MTSGDRIDVAVVGVGHLGKIHARILSEIPTCRLVAVVDQDGARAQEIAKASKCAALTSPDQLPPSVRAAVVATPTIHHHAVAGRLLDRGIACMVEKPLASTLAEATDLVDRARRAGTVLMVGHVERFNPAIVAILERRIVPRFIEAQRVSPFSFRSQDISVVLDMMIHDIDIILYLAQSPVETVDAVGVGVVGDLEDLANARITFENGAVANVTASRLALKTERKMRMFAPEGYVTLDFYKKTGQIIRPGEDLKSRIAARTLDLSKINPLDIMLKDMLRIEKLEIQEFEPLKREDTEFVTAIREGRAPSVTGEHGVQAMAVAERVVESIRSRLRRSGSAPKTSS